MRFARETPVLTVSHTAHTSGGAASSRRIVVLQRKLRDRANVELPVSRSIPIRATFQHMSIGFTVLEITGMLGRTILLITGGNQHGRLGLIDYKKLEQGTLNCYIDDGREAYYERDQTSGEITRVSIDLGLLNTVSFTGSVEDLLRLPFLKYA